VPTGVWSTAGQLNSGQGTYAEGNSIPFRLVLLCAPSTWSLTIQYDFQETQNSKTNYHFFDFLTTYNASDCAATAVTGHACDTYGCSTGPNTFPIPTDSSLPGGLQIPGSFTVYNGAVTNVSTYSTINGSTIAKQLTISGTSAGSGDILILWGGHLARYQDWGAGNGASYWPGGSGNMGFINFADGTGTTMYDSGGKHIGVQPGGISTESLSIADVTVTEPNSGTINAISTVTLSPASSTTVHCDSRLEHSGWHRHRDGWRLHRQQRNPDIPSRPNDRDDYEYCQR
jgi:hypothetical protein